MKVAISGLSGSGKTTLAKSLANHFSLRYISAGELFRRYAEEKGIALEELSAVAPQDLDKAIDSKTQTICLKEDNFVIEGRLTILFCMNAIKIFLKASLEERARRLSFRENKAYEEALKTIEMRDKADLERYHKMYGIEDYNETLEKRADLVIDTDKHNIDEMINIAKEFIKNHPSLGSQGQT